MWRRAWPVAFLLCAVASACSVPPEEPIVSDFFAASRLRDTTALARFATVVFEPRERGTVTSFRVERVSPERVSGETRIKEVVVRASIRDAAGRAAEHRLTIRLEKRGADVDPRALYGGWIVTGFTDLGQSRAAPRS